MEMLKCVFVCMLRRFKGKNMANIMNDIKIPINYLVNVFICK